MEQLTNNFPLILSTITAVSAIIVPVILEIVRDILKHYRKKNQVKEAALNDLYYPLKNLILKLKFLISTDFSNLESKEVIDFTNIINIDSNDKEYINAIIEIYKEMYYLLSTSNIIKLRDSFEILIFSLYQHISTILEINTIQSKVHCGDLSVDFYNDEINKIKKISDQIVSPDFNKIIKEINYYYDNKKFL